MIKISSLMTFINLTLKSDSACLREGVRARSLLEVPLALQTVRPAVNSGQALQSFISVGI